MGGGAAIKKLPDSVIRKIAAGEVVQRSSIGVKELIENAIDAGATTISIIVEKGGLKLISVKDNGCGIHEDDLPIVCDRYTTSKIKHFDDLLAINTFGFRGEALSSLAQVGNIQIVSKRASSDLGYKIKFKDGKQVAPVEACASVNGTTIMITDLFHNLPVRKSSHKNASYEYRKIMEIVQKYAILYLDRSISQRRVDFFCKAGHRKPVDISTTGYSSQSSYIGACYGRNIIPYLISISDSKTVCVSKKSMNIVSSPNSTSGEDYEKVVWKVNGWVTTPNYTRRKLEFVLFINMRLVVSTKLSKAVEIVYTDLVRKHKYPFVFLVLTLPQQHLDVNMHPTKSQVCFLFESEIISLVSSTIRSSLEEFSKSKSMVATVVPSTPKVTLDIHKSDGVLGKRSQTIPDSAASLTKMSFIRSDTAPGEGIFATSQTKKRLRPEYMVRESHTDGNLRAMWNIARMQSKRLSENDIRQNIPVSRDADRLTSISEIKQEVADKSTVALHEFAKKLVFVGIVNENLVLLQHLTGLYTVELQELTREFFYQRVFYVFGRARHYTFTNELKVFELLMIFLKSPIGKTKAKLSGATNEKIESVGESLCRLLYERKDMLLEYFRICLTSCESPLELCLYGVPELVKGYIPQAGALPVFLYRLCTVVNWEEEKQCFHTIALELASFYSVLPRYEPKLQSCRKDIRSSVSPKRKKKGIEFALFVEDVLVPNVRRYFLPPKSFMNEPNPVFSYVTSVKGLYKAFERC